MYVQLRRQPDAAHQLEQGARADVFASADAGQMELALQNGVVAGAGKVFAAQLAGGDHADGQPAGLISALPTWHGRASSWCWRTPEVPVGAYARQMLAAMDKDAACGAGFSEAAS